MISLELTLVILIMWTPDGSPGNTLSWSPTFSQVRINVVLGPRHWGHPSNSCWGRKKLDLAKKSRDRAMGGSTLRKIKSLSTKKC